MTIVDEVRFALRGFRKRPGFLAVALVTLAVAIGANVAVFTFVNGVLLRPLPFGDRSDRIVSVHAIRGSAEEQDWADARLSYLDLEDLRASGALEDVAGFVGRNFTLQDGAAERVEGGSVTPNLFALLGVSPARGRAFHAEEAAAPGLESVVVITHGLWQRRFGGRADIVGRPIQINGRAVTVVGVMPQGFAFPERAELYLPLRWNDAPRDQRTVATFALLKQHQTHEQAEQEVEALAARLARTYPATHRDWSMRVLMFRELMVGTSDRRVATTLLAAVAFVLLIGCANLAGLLLARGESRRREFAVRAALGASRWQLVRVNLVESAVVAALGTALGVIVASWLLDMAPYAFADGLPYWVDLRVDIRVVSFTVSIMAGTALLLGIAPGLRFSRPALNETLKSSSTGSTGEPGVARMRAALVIAQVALCVALVTAAILMVRSFVALQAAPSGFDDGRLLTVRTYLAGDQYDAIPARAARLAALVDELQRAPGISHAALTTSIPTDDGGSPIDIANGTNWTPGRELAAQQVGVSPSLFETLGLPIQGRTFTQAEYADAASDVVIVGQRLAARLFPGESPLDRRLGVVNREQVEWRRVIGVVPDVLYEEVGEETDQSRLTVYVPYARLAPRTTAMMLRTAGDPAASMAAIRALMRQRYAGVPAYDLRTMQQVRTYTTWEQRIFGQVMASFAVVALLLAWLGVYGLVAYTVARRTREIGVRIALGARHAHVLRMVAIDVAALAVAGVALGAVLGTALTRALESFVYGVNPRDPGLLAVAAAGMAAAMFVAAAWPARRALRIQPAAALRCD